MSPKSLTTPPRHPGRHPSRWLPALVLTGLAMTGTQAQPAGNADTAYPPDKTTWYTVEVILFRQGGNPGSHAERWHRNIELGYPGDWITLSEPETGEPETGEPETASPDETETDTPPEESSEGDNPPALPVLPNSEQTLQGVTDRLQRSNSYRVLFHEAWHQPFVEEQTPPAIIIDAGESYGDHRVLEGSIQLRLKRYLHVDTNLWLTDFATNFGQERERWPELPWPPHKPREEGVAPPDPVPGDGQDNTWTQLQVTNTEYDSLLEQSYIIENIALIQQSRRMRSEELHYIDHPLLGILIQFTPYDPEAEHDPEETQSEDSDDSTTDAASQG